jgi:hypothetical protein
MSTETQLKFDLTMGGAAALDSSALVLSGEEFDSLCVRINQLVEQRHDDAVLRRDVEQAFGELFPSKQKAAA